MEGGVRRGKGARDSIAGEVGLDLQSLTIVDLSDAVKQGTGFVDFVDSVLCREDQCTLIGMRCVRTKAPTTTTTNTTATTNSTTTTTTQAHMSECLSIRQGHAACHPFFLLSALPVPC